MSKQKLKSVEYKKWRNGCKDGSPSKIWICRTCNGLIETPHYCYKCYYRYCPNCGADMEETLHGRNSV